MPNSRKLVVAENISANGVIAFLDPWFDSGDQDDDDDLLEVIRGHTAVETALLLGRHTFEEFRGYWPKQTDDTTGPIRRGRTARSSPDRWRTRSGP